MLAILQPPRFWCHPIFIKYLVVSSLGLAGMNDALGTSLCVSSATELQKALTDASDNGQYAAQDVEIFIAPGTYKTGSATSNGPFQYRSTADTGYLHVYGTACGMPTNYDARQVVLDGQNHTQALNIQKTSGEVSMLGLTIQNGESAVAGGGLAVNTNVTGGTVQIANMVFRGNHTSSIGGGFSIDGLELTVFASLIVGNSADGGYGGAFIYSRNGLYAEFIRSTVADNVTSAHGGTGGLYCCGNTTLVYPEISSSIFSNNTNHDLELSGPAPQLVYDDYGTVTGVTDYTGVMITHVDPMFIRAGSNPYALDSRSPLLGYLPADDIVGFDVDGNATPTAGFVDIGAYEDTVFTDDLEAH
jgi:hypothetical protein